MSYTSAALRSNVSDDKMEKRDDPRLVERKAALEAGGYKVGLFWIPAMKLQALSHAIEKLQKRTRRLGLKPLVFEKGEPYYTNVPSTTLKAIEGAYGGTAYTEQKRTIKSEVTPVLVAGEEPRLKGWRLIACLDYDEEQAHGGPWLRVVPDEVLPAEFRTVEPTRCDHCLTKRDRATVFVLAHEDGKYAAVGRTCLTDFLGGHGDPKKIADVAETLFAIFDLARGMEDWEGLGGGASRLTMAVDIEEYLAVVIHVISKYGWVSRSVAYESGGGKRSTADEAWDICMPSRRGQLGFEVAKKQQPDPQEHEAAKRTIEWATKEFVDADVTTLTDYGYNVRQALLSGVVTGRSAGVVASLASGYQRAMAREAEKVRGDVVDGHFGTVDERIVLELDMLGVRPIEGNYGTTYLCSFRGTGDAAKYAFKWFGSSWPFEDFRPSEAAGKHVRVKATIKKHGEFRGQKETELSRVTPVGPEEPKKKRVSRLKRPGGSAPPEGSTMENNPLSHLRTAMRVNTEGADASPEQVEEIAHVVARDESDGDRFQINAQIQEKRRSRPPKRVSRPVDAKRTSRPNGTLVTKRTSRPAANGKRTSGHPGAKRISKPLWRNRTGETEERRLGPGVMGRVAGREVDPDRFSGARGHDIDAAMDKYETFHSKKPLEVVDVGHEPPARLVCIGDALSVSYRTDKWYADGKDIDYKHLHGKSEDQPYEVGKGVLFYENAQLADPNDVRKNGTTRPPRAYPKAWTRLGKYLGGELRRNDGEFEEIDSRKSARDCWLLCAPDGKMLAIYSPQPQEDGSEGFLAIMCGGGLRVLKDGIDG